MSKLIPNKEQLRKSLIYGFHLKNHFDYFEKLMVNVLHPKIVSTFQSGDFEVANKEHGKPPKNFEDVGLQALLNEDD